MFFNEKQLEEGILHEFSAGAHEIPPNEELLGWWNPFRAARRLKDKIISKFKNFKNKIKNKLSKAIKWRKKVVKEKVVKAKKIAHHEIVNPYFLYFLKKLR